MQRFQPIRNLILSLGATLLLPGCTLDFTAPCCPSGVVFMAQDPWVCPAHCPGGGVTRLNYEIQFEQEGEACDPGEDFTIHIENLTEGVLLPPLVWDNPGTGTYTGTVEVTLTQDTTFRIEADREKTPCAAGEAQLTVQAVDAGDSHDISLSGAIDPPQCTLGPAYFPFGPGVLVDHIGNLTHYRLAVTKDTHTEIIEANGQGAMIGATSEPATGNWSLGMGDLDECASSAGSAQGLSARVYLQCDCPTGP